MKNKIIFIFCISFLFFDPNFGLGQSDNPRSPFQSKLNTKVNSEEYDSEKNQLNWIEDQSARTLTSSTYFSDDNQIKIIQSKQPINYYNSLHELVPIKARLNRLDDNTWGAVDQPFPTFVYDDGSFGLTLDKNNKITIGKNCKINNQNIEINFNFTGDTMIFHGVVPGIDKELIFSENSLKYSYTISEPISGIQSNTIFSEEIELPKGYTIIEDASYGRRVENGWNGNMIVVNSVGTVVSTFHLPYYFDAADNYITGSYKVKEVGDKIILELNVPQNWLNDPARVYPVVIDPIVTGPTSNWLGGNMPSCLLPTLNKDSIQVTIPAGITVTQLLVTSSYFADGLTPAIRNDGRISFSTNCGTGTSYTLTGAPGQLPGGVYLEDFNLYNPLMCCFPESCVATSFYLTQNLGRTVLGTGCNMTYIRYDPYASFPAYTFATTVIGKTSESYAGQWSVSPLPICSNQCTISGTGYVYYGVAPYTFTHPWTTDVVTIGSNTGCGTGATNHIFSLTIPNCPSFCDETFTSLNVPPPTIIDACGNNVTGLPTKVVPIKEAPDVTADYDQLVCSEQPYLIDLTSCVPTASIDWSGNGNMGNGDIAEATTNTTTGTVSFNYYASASDNGCYSDTLIIPLNVQPLPIPIFSLIPDPIIAGIETQFMDESIINTGVGIEWYWLFGDGTFALEQNPTHLYMIAGEYEICLVVTNDSGCKDSLCELITVMPAELNTPNIITANNDGINDLLEFQYLDFFKDNELTILNRWGSVIYQKSGYINDWNGAGFTEGTYFYLLKIKDIDKTYSGFFQLVR